VAYIGLAREILEKQGLTKWVKKIIN
jgi:hypothetical protein